MYDMKALYQAESVQDAVALRVAHPDAQIIAGGSDVLVQMREGKRAGVELISIYGLDELRGVTLEADGTLRIGSLTSFSHITRDPLIQKYLHIFSFNSLIICYKVIFCKSLPQFQAHLIVYQTCIIIK